MLSEFLDEHPLIGILKGTVGCPFPSVGEDAWRRLDESVREDMRKTAEKYRDIPYPMLTASQFMAFVRSGSREVYETPYFLRRRKLIAAFLGCCVGEDDTDAVMDGLWCICEETSWVISAHNGSSHAGMRPARERPLPDVKNPYVDLFSAQTAMILSFIVTMMGEKLDAVTPLLRRRVALEIEKRVLTPFMTRDDYWWMGFIRKDLCNWTPWIVSNVMLTASLMLSDRLMLAELLSRGCRMLDRWIYVVPQDGGCDEGAGYWNMAGGALLDCLELLEQCTDGRMTFWQEEKLRNILSFPLKARLEGGWFVNFADCDARPQLSGERLQYAGERLHDAALIQMGAALRREASGQIGDTPQLWRLLNELFHPKTAVSDAPLPPKDVWLPDLQVRVLERGGTILVGKGGHNGESHNHNDVGSFMLYLGGEPQVVDAGNMVYTAKTFSDRRYELWNIRSRNHNVPLIGGFEQKDGTRYRAENAERLADGLRVDLAKAYPEEADVRVCRREMRLTDDGVLTLTDAVECGEAAAVTWVFMLRHEPKLDGNTAVFGPVRMAFPAGMAAGYEEIVIDDPRMAKNFPGSLWRLTVTDAEAESHAARFTFRRDDK